MVLKLVFNRVERAKMPFFARPIARGIARKVTGGFVDPNLERIVSYMEAELGRSEWFAGPQFSAADIQMSFPAEAAVSRAGGSRPNLARFLDRIHARPAYQRALERGGKFELLG
jgi:glutathione S-transferase